MVGLWPKGERRPVAKARTVNVLFLPSIKYRTAVCGIPAVGKLNPLTKVQDCIRESHGSQFQISIEVRQGSLSKIRQSDLAEIASRDRARKNQTRSKNHKSYPTQHKERVFVSE